MVFVTGTKDKKTEVVTALDRSTGKEVWRVEWPGAMSVPFFASANGDWIRSTPAYDGTSLFVAGMRDVLVSLNAKTGAEQWRVDFVKDFKTGLPSFGCVCSPLVDGDALYMQAGNSLTKLDKATGKLIWRCLEDGGGMMGGAFSSPAMAEKLAGRRQLVAQTREKLAGVDPETGAVLWQRNVPSFRGMNILTPLVSGNSVFTSTYQNKSWRFDVSETGGTFDTNEAWSNKSQAYMSTPVVIDGFISTAAAIIAATIAPQVKDYLIAAHCSQELGHRLMMEWLGVTPLLDMNMRLGEGTGAALAMSLVEASCKILDEMATFGEAGVSEKA
jgi:outer membrane protein assembly factor BamB